MRLFFYLEDHERTLDSPVDKIMLSVTTFADEVEREKARQRNIETLDQLKRESLDFYSLIRSIYRQHRRNAIRNGRPLDDSPESEKREDLGK